MQGEMDRMFGEAFGRLGQRESFSRVIPLPCEVDEDKIEAKYRNGELTLVLPKTEGSKPRRLDVTVS